MRFSLGIGLALMLLTGIVVLSFGHNDALILGEEDLNDVRATDQLIITGHNPANTSQTLVIRIDDSAKPSYAERINLERAVPPGDFKLSQHIAGLRKPNGQLLQRNTLQHLEVFRLGDTNDLKLQHASFERATPLPEGSIGWDLGDDQSALWPGFKRITANFPGIAGTHLLEIDRGRRQQAAEALTTDGIRGIDSLQLPLPAGNWEITLWVYDRSEWDYYPHALHREIRANGQNVLRQHLSPQDWIQDSYLAGRNREYQPGDAVWNLYGEQAQGRIRFPVRVGEDGLRLELTGDHADAGFIAAILAEPAGSTAAFDQVENARAQWWTENWRIHSQATLDEDHFQLRGIKLQQTLARGSVGQVLFTLEDGSLDTTPTLTLRTPRFDNAELNSTLRWGRWQLRRERLSGSLLAPNANHLRADASLPPNNGLPRRLHVEIHVPHETPAGRYEGELIVRSGERLLREKFTVTVPDITLPALDRPIGVYLERPMQFSWFQETQHQREQAFNCDLNYLRQLGLSGISPGLSTPDTPAHQAEMLQQVAQVEAAGFTPPYLAYHPFKRLQNQLGTLDAVGKIKQVDQTLMDQSLSPLLWSIADEPSNPGEPNDMEKIHRYARSYTPTSQLAGHLNNPADIPHAALIDIALVNSGFGVDLSDLRRLRARQVTPWFYNMENLRSASGFYLWRTNTQGYMQWHARMPTAAPYNPTDGREDDVQFLYATAEPCPSAHDVDLRLFELVEGINDLRWLLWLEQQTEHDPAARELSQQLNREIPTRWRTMLNTQSSQLNNWRARIIALSETNRATQD